MGNHLVSVLRLLQYKCVISFSTSGRKLGACKLKSFLFLMFLNIKIRINIRTIHGSQCLSFITCWPVFSLDNLKMLDLYLLGQNCLHLTFKPYLSSETYSRKYEKLPNKVVHACKIIQKRCIC